MKVIVNIIVTILIILMDIMKPFLVIFKLLGYIPILAIIFYYMLDGLNLKTFTQLSTISIITFGIYYCYFFIMDFLIGFKQGLINPETSDMEIK